MILVVSNGHPPGHYHYQLPPILFFDEEQVAAAAQEGGHCRGNCHGQSGQDSHPGHKINITQEQGQKSGTSCRDKSKLRKKSSESDSLMLFFQSAYMEIISKTRLVNYQL